MRYKDICRSKRVLSDVPEGRARGCSPCTGDLLNSSYHTKFEAEKIMLPDVRSLVFKDQSFSAIAGNEGMFLFIL